MMSWSPLKVSVIIPYQSSPIVGCLDSIKEQTSTSSFSIELISISEKDLGFKEKKGPGFMRNRGAEMSHGEILFFLDSDAIMFPDCLEKTLEIFSSHPEVGCISCLPMVPQRDKTDLLNWLLGIIYEDRIEQIGEGYTNVAASTGVAVRRKAFFDTGMFPEQVSYGEDWEFSLNLNCKIWHSNKIRVYHIAATSLWHYLRKQFRYAYYRVVAYKQRKLLGDRQTQWKTLIPSFFAPLLLFYLILWLFLPSTIIGLIYGLFIVSDFPLMLKLLFKRKSLEVLWLLPLNFVRNIVWISAAFKGFWDVYIKRDE